MRRTPLKQKRDRPRRDEGRIKHVRVKPKAGAPPTAEERRHMKHVGRMRCLLDTVPKVFPCGGRLTLHHVTASIYGGGITRSHKRVVPLCEAHHQIQHGPHGSVEALSHGGFHAVYGIDLLAEADRLWAETNSPGGAAPRPS